MDTERPHPVAVNSNPTTSKLALASIILGGCSFFCGIFSGLPAVVCGIISLNRLGKVSALKGTSLAVTGICLGVVSVITTGILAGLVIPALLSANSKALQMRTVVEGKELSVLLFTYANDHEGKYPDRLEDLVDAGYLSDSGILYNRETNQLRLQYTPGLTTSSPPKTVILRLIPATKSDARVIVSVDMSSEWSRH
ncbi:MAG: DUF4190 domain-containing protein [Verrucomicrobiota bacterium]